MGLIKNQRDGSRCISISVKNIQSLARSFPRLPPIFIMQQLSNTGELQKWSEMHEHKNYEKYYIWWKECDKVIKVKIELDVFTASCMASSGMVMM